MIDIADKPTEKRSVTAQGLIYLHEKTIDAIREKTVEKGDVIESARIAAFQGAKQTFLTLAHCHTILIDGIEPQFSIEKDHIIVQVRVNTTGKTGSDMESIQAVTFALTTIWDMVKKLEKDKTGQYPSARITDIRILKKVKS